MGERIYILDQRMRRRKTIFNWFEVNPTQKISSTVMQAWAMKNCKGKFSIFPIGDSWLFELEEDAVAFKIMWA